MGGDSDIEQKEKYDRVDDAVVLFDQPCRGYLPGGGLALWRCADLFDVSAMTLTRVAYEVLRTALRAPLTQILENAGKNPDEIMLDGLVDDVNGFDVKNEKYGDMFKMGVIDPVKVTKNALINAVVSRPPS